MHLLKPEFSEAGSETSILSPFWYLLRPQRRPFSSSYLFAPSSPKFPEMLPPSTRQRAHQNFPVTACAFIQALLRCFSIIHDDVMIITAQTMGQYGRIRHFVIIHFHNAKPVAFIPAPFRLLLSLSLSPAIFSGKPLQYLKITMTVPFQ